MSLIKADALCQGWGFTSVDFYCDFIKNGFAVAY